MTELSIELDPQTRALSAAYVEEQRMLRAAQIVIQQSHSVGVTIATIELEVPPQSDTDISFGPLVEL